MGKKITNPSAKRCDEVLKITKGKNFAKHTCYNCRYLEGPGDGATDYCEKKHKIALYIVKFGPFKSAVYHRESKTWACSDKK